MSTDAMQPPFDELRSIAPARSAGWLERLTDAICCLTAGGTVLVVLAQVASRLLGAPIPWSEELTRALFIWMVFMGLAASMRRADAARVTVFMQALPRVLRRASLPIYLACSVGFFAIMAWMGIRMVRQQLAMNESIATLGWPSWVIGLVVPVSAVLAILCTLASLRDHRASIALDDNSTAASETP